MNIIVIGGGAAGLMAAGTAAEQGANVTLFETNEKVGRKLFITGKGRCNVCNDCDAQEVLRNVPVNPRFLYSALGAFSPADVKAFFEEKGVALKTERGNRVFPVSDRASDIIDALFLWVRRTGVSIVHASVSDLVMQDGRVTGVRAGKKTCLADRVIVATGGASYPQTGSTGDGYRFAREAGHTVVPANPSLVPLVESGETCRSLMGLSLRNVQLTVFENEKKIYTDFGEMLFTHFGLSGPLVLSASAHMRHFGSKSYRVEIDLKPALDEKTLDRRLLADFDKHKNSDFINALGELLPRKLIPAVIEKSGIDPREKVNTITKKQRASLLRVLKCFPVEISGKRPIAEAIVTTGGVSVREVSPKTMESKKSAACTSRARCSTSTPTPAALICKSRGLPAVWPVCPPHRRRNKHEIRFCCDRRPFGRRKIHRGARRGGAAWLRLCRYGRDVPHHRSRGLPQGHFRRGYRGHQVGPAGHPRRHHL